MLCSNRAFVDTDIGNKYPIHVPSNYKDDGFCEYEVIKDDEVCEYIKCNDPHCDECSSANKCETCMNEYIMYERNCVKCHIPNCESCDYSNHCVKCSEHYLLESGQCIPNSGIVYIYHEDEDYYDWVEVDKCIWGYSFGMYSIVKIVKVDSTHVNLYSYQTVDCSDDPIEEELNVQATFIEPYIKFKLIAHESAGCNTPSGHGKLYQTIDEGLGCSEFGIGNYFYTICGKGYKEEDGECIENGEPICNVQYCQSCDSDNHCAKCSSPYVEKNGQCVEDSENDKKIVYFDKDDSTYFVKLTKCVPYQDQFYIKVEKYSSTESGNNVIKMYKYSNTDSTCSGSSYTETLPAYFDEPSYRYKMTYYIDSGCTNSYESGEFSNELDDSLTLDQCRTKESMNLNYKITCGKGYKIQSGKCIKNSEDDGNNGGCMKGIIMIIIALFALI